MNSISKITIAFCEGPHDSAFLYRILKTKCFSTFKDSLEKLPKVVGDFIVSKNKTVEYNLLKIDSLRNDFVPYKIMYKDDKLILLYSLGGDKDNNDDKKNKRLVILKHFFGNIEESVKDSNNYGNSFISQNSQKNPFDYKFLFFYDADEDKNEKIDIINRYLQKMSINEELEHNKIIKKDGYSIGAYIFSNKDDKGALEDILFDLMKIDNEIIFNKAQEFLKLKDESRLKRLKIKCQENIVEKRGTKQKLNIDKSIIGIVGQLQNSGASNVVTIEHSDYLNLSKIQNSTQLQEIASFLDEVI